MLGGSIYVKFKTRQGSPMLLEVRALVALGVVAGKE